MESIALPSPQIPSLQAAQPPTTKQNPEIPIPIPEKSTSLRIKTGHTQQTTTQHPRIRLFRFESKAPDCCSDDIVYRIESVSAIRVRKAHRAGTTMQRVVSYALPLGSGA